MTTPRRVHAFRESAVAAAGAARRSMILRRIRHGMHVWLRGLHGETVCLYPNPGNAGDALILVGTIEALARAGVAWDLVRPGDDVAGRTLLLGGGGNLVPPYGEMASALRTFVDTDPARIVVLPHGIRDHHDEMALLRSGDTVFCRDRVAFEHVRRHTDASVRLEHDMAFHLDAEMLLDRGGRDPDAVAFLEERLAEHGWSLGRLRDRPVVRFNRIDVERRSDSSETDIDLSFHLIHTDVDSISWVDAWALLRCIESARTIATDRLHVALGAALLGVPVQLSSNSYDKNLAVFETSLSRFPNVDFVGDQPSVDQ